MVFKIFTDEVALTIQVEIKVRYHHAGPKNEQFTF